MIKKPELLSPAGNPEKLKYAVQYGADAVYAGAKNLSLREGSGNFSLEELKESIDYVHSKGRKFYLTINAYLHQKDLKTADSLLKEISAFPPDALIVSDPGMIAEIRENYPDIPVHVSTQANTTNFRTVRFYEKLGVERVILARELSLDEIREIRSQTDIPLETFIHGAMCISYSGRCLLSNFLTSPAVQNHEKALSDPKYRKARDANQGDCAQSCRWKFVLMEEKRPHEYFPVFEDQRGTSVLSSKDLNLSGQIKELTEAGIDSLKIEGRMKSVYYTANVTRVYRYIIDMIAENRSPSDDYISELNKVSHREYTTGFYFKHNRHHEAHPLEATPDNQYIRDYTFLGTILENHDSQRYTVLAKNKIQQKDRIEIITPDFKDFIPQHFDLYKNGKFVDHVQPNDVFEITFHGEDLPEADHLSIIRKKTKIIKK